LERLGKSESWLDTPGGESDVSSGKEKFEAVPQEPERNYVAPPSRAQNIFALVTFVIFVAFVGLGGWYMRIHNRAGGVSDMHMGGHGMGRSAAHPSMQIGSLKAELKGDFRKPESEIKLEFRNAQGQLVDVGQVKLALNMNMPGMVMREDAEVGGNGGRYTAKVKAPMVGDWSAKLSFNGPQGSAEKTFRVSVK